MNKNISFLISALVLLLASTAITISQVQFKIPIFFQGTGASDTCRLWLGVSGDGPDSLVLDNTRCPDTDPLYGSIDEWGEACDGPGPWDFHASFTVMSGCSTVCSKIFPNDFRGFFSESQSDTFFIEVFGNNVGNGSVTISWPVKDVLKNAGGPSSTWGLRKKVGTTYIHLVDMTTTTSYIDTNAALDTLIQYRIIKRGARIPGPPGPNFVITTLYYYGSSLDYGDTYVGESSITPIVVLNTGEVNTLLINGVTAPSGYNVTPNPPATYPIEVAPKANYRFDITFTPSSVGTFAGDVVFEHNAEGGITNLPVTGNGDDADPIILPSLQDTIFTSLSGDTVVFWNLNVIDNCACQFKFSVNIHDGNKIIITENDTSGMSYQCICIYNLSTNIIGLNSGTYTIHVYRNYSGQRGYQLGSTTLTIEGTGSSMIHEPASAINSYQSACINTNTYISVQTNWNLVSVPYLQTNYDASVLFPGKLGDMYMYNTTTGGYNAQSILANGIGYWVNYPGTNYIPFNGLLPITLTFTASQAGWALIGSQAWQVPVSSLVLDNGAVINGSAYSYDPVSQGYQSTPTIDPGQAVWINVSKACTITFP